MTSFDKDIETIGRIDAHNQRLLERVQLGGEAFLSSTTVGGRFALRACFVNPHTTRDDVDHAVRVILREAANA